MNCRGCGRRIPESYLKLDCFECPHCGRRYRRTAAQAKSSAVVRRDPKRADRSRDVRKNVRAATHRDAGILEKLKRIALRRVWELSLIAWAAVILLLAVGIVENATNEGKGTEKYVQVAAEKTQIETELEPPLATSESTTEAPANSVAVGPFARSFRTTDAEF